MKTLITLFAIIFTAVTAIAQPRGEQAIFNATSNSYIDYGKGMNLNGYNNIDGGSKLSITLWVKWDDKSVAGSWANIFTLNDSISNGDKGVFWIQHSQNNDKFEFALTTQDGNRKFIQSTTNPQAGIWYHIACVFDGTLNSQNMKLYVNGVLEASATTQTNINQNHNSRKINNFSNVSKLYAGRWAYMSSTRNFNGLLDELSVWSKALTSVEINNIRNNPESITGVAYNAANLVGYYNFDNGLTDDLTNRNDGVNGGGVIVTNNTNLPIELISFNVKNNFNRVVVEWSTATEINNNFFTIERSLDGVNAEVIGIVKGAGNSNSVIDYKFEDNQPSSGVVYYRIKQTDFDGTSETFDWKAVNMVKQVDATYSIYPNPTQGKVNVKVSSLETVSTIINVLDISGRVVYSQNIESDSSLMTSFDMPSDINAGIYFVEVINGSKRYVEKIVLN